ncbi:hypothetical protein [Burkholderia ubonensis]|nr:hypothetical protein [Burkholderia ubonensis]
MTVDFYEYCPAAPQAACAAFGVLNPTLIEASGSSTSGARREARR